MRKGNFQFSIFNFQFELVAVLIYKSLPSTNTEAKKAGYRHGDAIIAREQTAGRGQRGNKWSARAGENLTFSLVWEPTFLEAKRQFLLSEAVALGLVDALAEWGIATSIKWTNDIYVGNDKICGILIEHDLGSEGKLARTIVGIGLNINQREFPADLPNPTSMALLRSASFDRREVLERYMANLEAWYGRLLEGNKSAIEERYRELMYHLDEQHIYALASGEKFRAIIRGVRPSGELRLEHEDGTIREYAFKEVEFVLPHKQ